MMPNPYPCVEESTVTGVNFFFKTDQEVSYIAYFSDYGYMFGSHEFNCRILSFDLDVIGSLRPPKFTPTDFRIADTVRELFFRFLQNAQNVIVAVYDSSDKHEAARQRKFNSWFEHSQFDYLEKHDFEIDAEDYMLLSSLFIHTNTAHKEAIIDRYQLILENGNIPLD